MSNRAQAVNFRAIWHVLWSALQNHPVHQSSALLLQKLTEQLVEECLDLFGDLNSLRYYSILINCLFHFQLFNLSEILIVSVSSVRIRLWTILFLLFDCCLLNLVYYFCSQLLNSGLSSLVRDAWSTRCRCLCCYSVLLALSVEYLDCV